jgi:hypothetical protein
LNTVYRTKAIVPITKPTTLVAVLNLAKRQQWQRVTLVLAAWAPAHALLVVACGLALRLTDPFLLTLTALAALPCALYACAFRSYDENLPLTALFAPSPRTSRLMWAALLLVPFIGVVAYLATRAFSLAPEPTGTNPRVVDTYGQR